MRCGSPSATATTCLTASTRDVAAPLGSCVVPPGRLSAGQRAAAIRGCLLVYPHGAWWLRAVTRVAWAVALLVVVGAAVERGIERAVVRLCAPRDGRLLP